jgi:nucleoside-diphosphate-sugar epimerase
VNRHPRRVPVSDLAETGERAPASWNELQGARVFLTGGTGFFGCWLLETLIWAKASLGVDVSVTVLTRDAGRFRRRAGDLGEDPALSFVTGDVSTFDFPAGSFTHVIHAAAESSRTVPGLETWRTVVEGTSRVLEFARTHGARKFLFVSSGAVYGPQSADVSHVSEESLVAPSIADPSSAYGESKRAAELLSILTAAGSSFEVKIARCFAFVGPHLPLDAHFAIGNFIRDALNGDRIHLRGDGTAVRSYLYAADLAFWLVTILTRGEAQRAYNVGSEEAISIRDLACLVAAELRPGLDIEIAGPARTGPPDRYVPSTRRAREELGLASTVSLRDAIRRTAAWHRGI